MGKGQIESVTRVGALALLLVAAIAVAFLDPEAAAHATKPMPRVTISGKVLLGDSKAFRAVGVVDRKAIFDAIPSVRMLRTERVSKNSARYHFLVYDANRRFQRAVELASQESKVDLIVDVGGVSAAGIEVVDLTELTRSMLGRDS